ncbi:16S rRNA (cytosine(1402)-N(4))-methyltransferase RsmH [Ligilactobacillus sp. LYQ60]|uniref:16S rRNA (cytosine(1402)-N(4))-methyltransferase RsmH n=1 Tax=unclassified Ligilactobacillus TaxID=2767920 RepID=UPI003853B3FC
MSAFNHITVLKRQAVDYLNVQPTGLYVDCTLGGGGHTGELLHRLGSTGKVVAFDQDRTAITFNEEQYQREITAGKLVLVQDNFRNLQKRLETLGITTVDGVLYDLGVSSPQFDDVTRGFSYRNDAPLDMRMNQEQQLTARTIVNEWSYADLVRIFFRYGEEKYAKSIARHIERAREEAPIGSTGQLVELIKQAIPAKARRTGGHPAKRTFQAIRIAVNDELGALEESLAQALSLLVPGGRISVITFQSLEDRLVKRMFRERAMVPNLPAGLPVIPKEDQPDYRLVVRKPVTPPVDEVTVNRRAHSAKLRVIERIK